MSDESADTVAREENVASAVGTGIFAATFIAGGVGALCAYFLGWDFWTGWLLASVVLLMVDFTGEVMEP